MSKRIWPGLPPQSDPDYERAYDEERKRGRDYQRHRSKRRKEGALILFSALIAGGMVVFRIIRSFQCIDCSETRLFLNDWEIYTVGVVLVIGAYWLAQRLDDGT